jgi:hypothetical protein
MESVTAYQRVYRTMRELYALSRACCQDRMLRPSPLPHALANFFQPTKIVTVGTIVDHLASE